VTKTTKTVYSKEEVKFNTKHGSKLSLINNRRPRFDQYRNQKDGKERAAADDVVTKTTYKSSQHKDLGHYSWCNWESISIDLERLQVQSGSRRKTRSVSGTRRYH
jgi:hypothetical protein